MPQDIGDSYVAIGDDDVRGSATASSPTASVVSVWSTARAPVSALAIYFVGGYLYYNLIEGWSWVDCIYFSVEIVTTVGYGDITPEGDATMLFTSFYVVAALTIVATSLSKVLDVVIVSRVSSAIESVEAQRQASILAASGNTEEISGQKEKHERHKHRVRYFKAIGAYVFWIVVGTLYYGTQRDMTSQMHGNPMVHGFYFSVITLCTVGFGDFVPKNDSEKLFDIFFMLVGIPTFANALTAISDMIWSEDVTEELAVLAGLDSSNMMSLLDFEDQLMENGCGTEDDDRIDKFEYLAFILVSNNIIKMDVLKQIMKSFESLDADGSGYLEYSDLPGCFLHDKKDDPARDSPNAIKRLELELERDILETVVVKEAVHAGIHLKQGKHDQKLGSIAEGTSNIKDTKHTKDMSAANSIKDTNHAKRNNILQQEETDPVRLQRIPNTGIHKDCWARLSQGVAERQAKAFDVLSENLSSTRLQSRSSSSSTQQKVTWSQPPSDNQGANKHRWNRRIAAAAGQPPGKVGAGKASCSPRADSPSCQEFPEKASCSPRADSTSCQEFPEKDSFVRKQTGLGPNGVLGRKPRARSPIGRDMRQR